MEMSGQTQNVLLTPKKQAKFIWPDVVLLCIKMQHVLFVLQDCKQSNSLTLTRC